MRTLTGTFTFLAVSLPMLAQAPARNASVVIVQAQAQGCPVGFAARRAPDGGLVSVKRQPKAPQQSYQLTFTPAQDRRIAQARITLHGLAGGRVIPAKDSANGDATESFNLSPSETGSQPLFHSTVYTSELTGVQWVELNELTYADGTTWHESAGATCRIKPNGYMLVAGR